MAQLVPAETCTLLEEVVDRCGLDSMLYALSEMASEKAQHIRASYDAHDRTALAWEQMASRLGTCAAAAEDKGV